jgi:hypothetical protein
MGTLNEEWSARRIPFGLIPPELPKPAPPKFTISGKEVDTRPGWAQPSQVPQPSAAGDTAVSRAYRTAVKVRDAHAKYVQSLQASAGYYSPDGYRAELAKFANSPEAAALDAAEQEFAQRKAAEAARLDSLRKGVNRPGDVADELRRGRIWDRDKARLDAAADAGRVAATAQELIDGADPDGDAVLAEQLPAYLQSRNVPGGWVNDAFAEKIPELGAAQADLDNLNQAEAVLAQTLGAVRRGIQAGRPADPKVLVDPSRFDPDRATA